MNGFELRRSGDSVSLICLNGKCLAQEGVSIHRARTITLYGANTRAEQHLKEVHRIDPETRS